MKTNTTQNPVISQIQGIYFDTENQQKAEQLKLLQIQQDFHLQTPIEASQSNDLSSKGFIQVQNLCATDSKIESLAISPQQLRRITKEAKYSSLQTLSMQLLRKEGLYIESKRLAMAMKIKERKNYSIILLRLSFLYHQKVHVEKLNKISVVNKIFSFLQASLDSCLKQKYKQDENFIHVLRKKIRNDVCALRKVFESNLSDEKTIIQHLIGIYKSDPNKKISLTHAKNARNLANLIINIVQGHGEKKQCSLGQINKKSQFEENSQKFENRIHGNIKYLTNIFSKLDQGSEDLDCYDPHQKLQIQQRQCKEQFPKQQQ